MKNLPLLASLFALALVSTREGHLDPIHRFLIEHDLESWARIPVPRTNAEWKEDATEHDNNNDDRPLHTLSATVTFSVPCLQC